VGACSSHRVLSRATRARRLATDIAGMEDFHGSNRMRRLNRTSSAGLKTQNRRISRRKRKPPEFLLSLSGDLNSSPGDKGFHSRKPHRMVEPAGRHAEAPTGHRGMSKTSPPCRTTGGHRSISFCSHFLAHLAASFLTSMAERSVCQGPAKTARSKLAFRRGSNTHRLSSPWFLIPQSVLSAGAPPFPFPGKAEKPRKKLAGRRGMKVKGSRFGKTFIAHGVITS